MPDGPQKTVLIVDDDDAMRDTLVTVLKHVYRCFAAESAEQAIAILQTTQIDLLLTDVRLPGADGIALTRLAKADVPDIEVVVLSVLADIDIAVKAIQSGAFNYLVKNFEYETLHALLANASERQDLHRLNASLRDQIDALPPPVFIGGTAPAMRQVLSLVAKVAPLTSPLLLTGETGTGKTLLAHHVHSRSQRSSGPFIEVRTDAAPEALEAALFGYEAGAIPGAVRRQKGKLELASGGTLLLDDVADLTPDLQKRLLRVLEEGHTERVGSRVPTPTDIRLIVATRSRLFDRVQAGHFRADLYYRLSGIPIHLPPLAERLDDLPDLISYFLTSLHRKTPIESFAPDAIRSLRQHEWPGNVRELRSLVERLAALHDDPIITTHHLPLDFQVHHAAHAEDTEPVSSFASLVTEFEQRLITKALERSGGNLAIAARELAIPLSTLKYKVRRHKLRETTERGEGGE